MNEIIADHWFIVRYNLGFTVLAFLGPGDI
jgi:hypothetical protein